LIAVGAVINAVFIIIGGGIGLLLKGRISEKFSQSLIKVMGLCVFVIGVSGAVQGDIMLLVVSMALGAAIGEVLRIDDGLNWVGDWVQARFGGKSDESAFAQGFVTCTLIFCVGAMAIVGSIDSGLVGDRSVIVTKSIIDAVTAMMFASSLGVGVLFSALPVLIYQGVIEFFAGFFYGVFTDGVIRQISAVGGVMILAIGFNMVMGARIKVANLLPGFLVGVGYYLVVM